MSERCGGRAQRAPAGPGRPGAADVPGGAWDRDRARRFAERWLPAWTGNRPEFLASFYASDAFYADPAIPEGVSGREALAGYFGVLLGRFPDWVWRQTDATPLEDGFLNHWEAEIPVGGRTVRCRGVCTVQLRAEAIYRNEVFFDRSELLAALRRQPAS